jgi:hypothetical protein
VTRIKERYAETLEADANNQLNTSIGFDYDQILLAARRTAFDALYEEARLMHVDVELIPACPQTAGGVVAIYIDRNTADAAVSLENAILEQEVSYGKVTDRLKLRWVPRSPEDREFRLLSSWAASSNLKVVSTDLFGYDATKIAQSQQVATVIFTSTWEFRGRST